MPPRTRRYVFSVFGSVAAQDELTIAQLSLTLSVSTKISFWLMSTDLPFFSDVSLVYVMGKRCSFSSVFSFSRSSSRYLLFARMDMDGLCLPDSSCLEYARRLLCMVSDFYAYHHFRDSRFSSLGFFLMYLLIRSFLGFVQGKDPGVCLTDRMGNQFWTFLHFVYFCMSGHQPLW